MSLWRKVDVAGDISQYHPPMKDETLPHIIFVCGTRHSGSNLLLDFLSVPRNAGWIPERLAEQPKRLSIARSVHRQNWPLLGEFFLERRNVWKSLPEPASDSRFLAHYLSNFEGKTGQTLMPGPEHVSDQEVEALREAVKSVAFWQRRNNVVIGYEDLPRFQMLRHIFPEAKFIQTIRDPRSVAYQMIRKIMKVDHPLLNQRKQYIDLMPEVLQQRLQDLPDTPISFCGVYTRWVHEVYKQEMSELPEGDQLEVAYSDLMSRPEVTLKKTLKFAGFPFDKRFKYYLKFHDIQVSNLRVNRNLSTEEAEQLAQAVAPIE